MVLRRLVRYEEREREGKGIGNEKGGGGKGGVEWGRG